MPDQPPEKPGDAAAVPSGAFPAYVVERRGGEPPAVHHGLSSLTVDELPPGEVLIAVEWSAVNYKDSMVTRPGNRVARLDRLVPGVDLAGTVVESTDPEIEIGAAVLVHGRDLGVGHHGGFAAYARVPASWVVPLPSGLTAREAMILGTAGFTAALSFEQLERQGLEPGGGPVLVTGASGGVGSLAVAIGAARGYEIVASSGKADQEPWLRALGASEVVGRDALDLAPERTLGPERWAGAVDCVGGTTLAKVLRTLRYGAAVAASGLTGGAGLETTVYPFIVRNVACLGVDTVATAPAVREAVWQRLSGDLRPPDIEALVSATVGLDELAPVLERIGAGRIAGRVLVRPR